MSDQRPAPGTRLKILLVEDSPRMQEILTESLQTVPSLELADVAEGGGRGQLAGERKVP